MILDDILKMRAVQLKREKEEFPEEAVKRACEKLSLPAKDFKGALCGDGISVIAEVKKASPSKGLICADFNPAKIAGEYEEAGASAVSVLTEEHYFMGGSRYLKEVRERISLPILRKDFIIDEYQIYLAKYFGADCVLLILRILSDSQFLHLLKLARSLNLEVLIEVHNKKEIQRLSDILQDSRGLFIGINSRDIDTLSINYEGIFNLLSFAKNIKIPIILSIISLFL